MDQVDAMLRFLDDIPADAYAASGMVRVEPEHRVPGNAFVPVGRGHAPDVAFPRGGVMVLGQDFGNERDLEAVIAAREETDVVPTWREIGKALIGAEIPPEGCWRTNYVMGVRRGSKSNCGRSPGLRRGALRRACRELFGRQVRAQEPCAVVVLGTHVPVALAVDFPCAFGAWREKSFSRRDLKNGAAMRDVNVDGVTVPLIVSILHPSMCGPNLWRRQFDGQDGAEAEWSLLRLVSDMVRERWTAPT